MKNIVALTLIGLAVEAMAVAPVAVWDGDFTTTKKGGWTLSSTGSTITDAKITIGSTPITMTPPADQKGGWYTVIYKVKGLKNTSQTPLATWGRPYVAGYNNADLVGAFLDYDYTWGVWDGKEREQYSQQLKIGLSAAGTEEHRVIVRFHSTANYGVWAYVDGTKVFTADKGLKATMDVNRMTILGFQYNGGNVLTGAEVTGLAIFSESSDAGDAAYVSYKFPSDPKTYAATASSGEVAWADLQWTPEGGGSPVSSAELPKNGILRVTVSSGATLLVAGSDAAQVAQLESITGPGTIRKVGSGTTTIASGKIQASGMDAQPLAAVEVSGGTLKLGDANAWVFSVQNRVGVPLTVTGGTLDIADAKTFSTADGSGWLYSKAITLGGQGTDRPTIVGGSVTPYYAGELEMLHYVGGNGANAPATFGAAIYSTYQKDNRVRKVNVEKGRGSAEGGYDLEMTGVLGTHNDSAYLNAFLFTKTGEGVLRVSNTNNFPNTTVSAGTYQLGCPEALPANLSVASTATLDLGGLALTNRSLTCGGTIANGTLVSSGVTVNLTGATIGANLSLVVDLADAIAGLKPFAGVDYAKVTTVGENPYLTYNTETGTFTLRDDCKLGDELKWLPIGDSITEGEQYMGHPGQGTEESRGGYRYQLWNEFEQAGQITRSVGYRTGHSGTVEDPETCRWAWHAAQYGGVIMHDSSSNPNHGSAGLNVENTLEVAGYPDIVTVLIGVNDLSFVSSSTAYEWVFTTWRNMVAKYADQRPHSKIVVSTLLPAGKGRMTYIAPFNAFVRNAARDKAAPFDRPNVVFADIAKIAFNDEAIAQYFKSSDFLHPNETGAKIVAAAWMKALQPVMAEIAQSSAVPVQVHNGTPGKVSVRFSKAIKSIDTAMITITGTNVNGKAVSWSFTDPTINSNDPRIIEFDAGKTELIGGDYTATLSYVIGTDANGIELPSTSTSTSTSILGTGAAANVPAAFRKSFERLQAINVTECNYGGNGPNVPCEKLSKAERVTHVGYYVELQRANEAPQFVWVSMDAKPFNYTTNNVGIPTVKGGIIRSRVTELQVYGNRGNFTNTAVGDTTQTGVIEFSPWVAGSSEPGGDDFPKELKPGHYGWNDALTDTSTLWGCMQVARETHVEGPDDYTKIAAEMIFAFNTFNSQKLTDLGIGTFSTHRNNAGGEIKVVHDWTDFVEKTGYTPFMLSAYQVKKIEIWVKTPKTSMMLFVK